MAFDKEHISRWNFYSLVTHTTNTWTSPTCDEVPSSSFCRFSLASTMTPQVWQPMDQPMTDYFIFSSHNTYLEGNQYKSDSNPEMYRRALMQGCKCVCERVPRG